MNYRPYPDRNRAWHQVERHHPRVVVTLYADMTALGEAVARISRAFTPRPACSQPSKEPAPCPGCGHDHHAPGNECGHVVEHGPQRWHICLCLATPGASRACPPLMDCQGGPLELADILNLRQGRSLRRADGETITPDVLAEEPMFGVPGCTCRPWTRQTSPPRYLDQPGDTVNMISGWERGADCPYHAEATDAR